MPKVSSPVIRPAIITSRKKKDGNCPIVIRVQWNGRYEKYLPISVPQNMWDCKSLRVKKIHTSSISYNKAIVNELQKAETKMLEYQRLNIPFTGKMLLSDDDNLLKGNSLVYADILERMLSEKNYAYHTANLYRYSYNLLVEYLGGRKDFLIIELTSSVLEGFCRWCLKTRKLSSGSINSICARIGKLYRYSIESHLVDASRFPYPFSTFNYWKFYKCESNRFGLDLDIIQMLENDYISHIVECDGLQGTWWYRDGVVDTLLNKRYSELFCQCLLLMCFHMQGLSLADMVRIKAENITIQKIDGDEYYIFSDLRRVKTMEQINVISVKRTDTNAAIFDVFVSTMDKRDGYFLPILYKTKSKREEFVVQAMSSLISSKIKKIFDRIDRENNGIITELGIDVSKITYYSFRHSFATAYIRQGGNPFALADLMGRSVNNINVYVNGLHTIKDLIKAKSILDN